MTNDTKDSCVCGARTKARAAALPARPCPPAGEGEDVWPEDLPEPPMHSRSMRLNSGLSDSFKRTSFTPNGGGSSNPEA